MVKKAKEPVRIREKKLADGNVSLYLDCYVGGRRYYEFLKLYIIPERTRFDKERNKTTLMQAEKRKAEKILQIQQGKFGIVSTQSKVKISEVCDMLAKTKNAESAKKLQMIRKYIIETGDIKITDANKDYILAFIETLKRITHNGKHLGNSTIHYYVIYLGSVFKYAVKNCMCNFNPVDMLDDAEKPKADKRQICHLTIEELEALAEKPCRNETLKRAFMFCCFTGLRYSDVLELKWTDIQDGCIIKQQKKTGEIVKIPVSANARKWLPIKIKEQVFFGLIPNSEYVGQILGEWVKAAGITKHVTFHVSRHTAATLWLTYGADLYTTSKLLGHTNIQTTQVYAEVVDKKKENAVNQVPELKK